MLSFFRFAGLVTVFVLSATLWWLGWKSVQEDAPVVYGTWMWSFLPIQMFLVMAATNLITPNTPENWTAKGSRKILGAVFATAGGIGVMAAVVGFVFLCLVGFAAVMVAVEMKTPFSLDYGLMFYFVNILLLAAPSVILFALGARIATKKEGTNPA